MAGAASNGSVRRARKPVRRAPRSRRQAVRVRAAKYGRWQEGSSGSVSPQRGGRNGKGVRVARTPPPEVAAGRSCSRRVKVGGQAWAEGVPCVRAWG